jgi:RHS repeat-associated protein
LAERLGSIDTLTDKDGNVVDKRTFDSFGRVLSETNPSVSFRYGYTARERDLESGLSYYRARYYDPQVGRFISVDPMGFGAGDTNLYRYVGNSSTNYADPSGKILPFVALAAAIATGVELAVEGAVLFGLGAAAINVVRQNIDIAQGHSDGFKFDQFAQSGATGVAFGLTTPFLGVKVLTAIGALGTGFSLLSAKNEFDNQRYSTAAFDALTAVPFGFLGKLATEKLPSLFKQIISGKQPHLNPEEVGTLQGTYTEPIGKRSWQVDPYLKPADLKAEVLTAQGNYVVNPTARKLLDMVTETGKIGGKNMNGKYMYVIDKDGNIIFGTRGKNIDGETLRMPHPTLIGGKNPQAIAAGMIEIRAGKIYEVDNVSGHFKPGAEASKTIAEKVFKEQLPSSVFHKDFKGFTSDPSSSYHE